MRVLATVLAISIVAGCSIEAASVAFATKFTQDCPLRADTNVAFYGTTGLGGVGDLSYQWMNAFLGWWQVQDASLKFQELNKKDINANCDLSSFPNLQLFIMPGGNAYYMQRSLKAEGRTNILKFLNERKGGYFGACAGYYYAAPDYIWQSELYQHDHLLGYFPYRVEGSILDIADYEGKTPFAVTPLSTGHNAIYYGGPTTNWRDTSNPPASTESTVLADFSALPPNTHAVISYRKMLLTSAHLEAFEGVGVTGLSTADRLANYILLANMLNQVTGTSFSVPGTTAKPPVTTAKPPVTTAEPPATTAEPPVTTAEPPVTTAKPSVTTTPAVVFADSFNTGSSFSAPWSTSGSGRPWYIKSGTAFASRTGAGRNAYLDVQIPGAPVGGAGNSLQVSYTRKVVGLDGADKFQFKYQVTGAGGWTQVESVNRRTDDNFVARSFTVPATVTTLRFVCECGARSESCAVDNVVVKRV